MTKKLHAIVQLKFDPGYRKYLLITNLLLLVLYLNAIDQASAQSTTVPFTTSEESISYDFNDCHSFSDGSNYDYSEFNPASANSCSAITGSQLYRHSGKHSCTNDEEGNAGDAICIQSSLDEQYSADHSLAVRFDITLSGNHGKKGRLDGITFKQLAPHNYLWSADGYADATGPNNYPTKFGIRISRDGNEIYTKTDIATTQSWETKTFDFTNIIDFTVNAGDTNTFTFELISYAPVGNGAAVSAWDLDDLKVFSSCEEDCDLTIDAGADIEACEGDNVELTALVDGVSECNGGCEYPIQKIARCHDSSNFSDVWLENNTSTNRGFVSSTSNFETFSNGTARYTAMASNGIDDIEVDIIFSGYTTTPPVGSPKENDCEQSNTSDWVYWPNTSGTIKTMNHGTLTISRAGPSMQMGDGADVTRTGFGASGWLTISGGDGYYTAGDINLKLSDCIAAPGDSSTNYIWTTDDGNIIGNADQKTITVDKSGTYNVSVSDCKSCEATDAVIVNIGNAHVDAGEDQTICIGEEVMITADGEGEFLWSTGETTSSIKVSPETTTEYIVIITNGQCEAMDEVIVTVEDKMIIGDYVWLDENRNGIQDDGQTGINGVSVKLFQCDGSQINATETASGPNGEAGYYQFEVCSDSGEYYMVFGDIPEGLEFTVNNAGDDAVDSDTDVNGTTSCFTIINEDDLTIDAGLNEICDISLEVIEDATICADETLELTASLTDNTGACEGGCEYPILDQDRCHGPTGNFEIWLESVPGGNSNSKFKASEQKFETFDDGSARYIAVASNGIDNISVNALFTGNTKTPGPNGPKPNDCQEYDMSDWEYWSTWSGTITSENHGVFNLSLKGTYFQLGVGADIKRTGFGASGWFFVNGGDGFYSAGDINVTLEECVEKGATFKWTTTDGNIVSDVNQRTISVDSPGTYTIEAVNCIDCVAVKTVVVSEDRLCSKFAKGENSPKMSMLYPVPVQSGGTLTVEFDIEEQITADIEGKDATASNASVSNNDSKESVSVTVYDFMGRVVSVPRTFDLLNGKAIVYLDLDYIPSGKYIVKAEGLNWSHSKHIIVK